MINLHDNEGKDVRRSDVWSATLPAMVPRNLSNDTFATLPMTGEVTTATVIAAHFQL